MAHITSDDVVPALRTNLAFTHLPQGLGTDFVSVKNVSNGEEFRLRGFEYSLARMLDGRRTAAQVVEAAQQVGLPVTLSDLEAFVHKLNVRHLVSPTPTAPDPDDLASFEGRANWDEQTRKLYRTALREGRNGNLNRALVSLDCLLNERPDNEEARHLRQKLEKRQRAAEAAAPFRNVFAQAERDWKEDETATVELPATRRRVGLRVAAAALTLGALAIAASLVPFPHQVTRQATLFPVASARVAAPRTGKVATVPVEVGQWVDKGTVLYTYDATDQLHQLEGAVARLDALNRTVYAHLPPTKAVHHARLRLLQAEARLATAQSRSEKQPTSEGSNEAVNWALKESVDAREALDALVPQEQQDAVRAQRMEVQMLEAQLLDNEVKAPISGVISMLGVQPESDLVKGMGSAQIDDTRQLKAITMVEPRDLRGLAAGQPVLLLSNGRATNTTIASTSGRTVEIRVDNEARLFEPGTAEVQIRGRPVPLIR